MYSVLPLIAQDLSIRSSLQTFVELCFVVVIIIIIIINEND